MGYVGNSYTVYKHIFPNEKVYIGITSRPVERRWNSGYGYVSSYVGNAIQKYGWKNVRHEILAEHKTKEEAERLEIYYIDKYKSANKKYGYNILLGGNSYKHSYESSLILSKSRRGKLSHDMKCMHTPEANKKASERRKGAIINNKPVYCEETKQIYSSATECSNILHIREHSITRVCRGERYSTYSKHFRYLTQEEIDSCYKVYMLTNTIGNHKYIGVTKQALDKRIRKGKGYKPNTNIRKAIETFGWENFTVRVCYYTLDKQQAGEYEKQLIKRYDTINNGYNIQSGGFKGFTSPVNDLAREHMSVAHKGKHSSPSTEFKKGVLSKAHYKNMVPIYCVELDKTFNSVAEARKELGLSTHISQCLKGTRHVCGGYHWKLASEVSAI